jgi:hypothetical protein
MTIYLYLTKVSWFPNDTPCYEMIKEHCKLVGYRLLDSSMDYPIGCYIYPCITKIAEIQKDVCKRRSATGCNNVQGQRRYTACEEPIHNIP